MFQINDRVLILANEYPGEYGRTGTIKEVNPSEGYGFEYSVQRDGDPFNTFVTYVEGELEPVTYFYVRWYDHVATENHILPADRHRHLHGGILKYRTLCGKWFSDFLYRGTAPEDVSVQVRRGQFRNAVCPRCAEIAKEAQP